MKRDQFLKILPTVPATVPMTLPVTLPVTVPLKIVNIKCKLLIINEFIELIKLQLYFQLFLLVHLKKVLVGSVKFVFLDVDMDEQVDHFRLQMIFLIFGVKKPYFKRDLRDF